MNLKFACFIFIFTITISSFCATSIIKGEAKGAENLSIRLYVYDDFISNKEKLLKTAKIDSTGRFEFKIDNIYDRQVIPCFFRIMNYNCSGMFIESGKTYNIKFEYFDFKDPNRIHIPLLSKINVPFALKDTSKNELNNLISSFNYDYDNFVASTFGSGRLAAKTHRAKIDSFMKAETEKYANVSNEFFKNYLVYSIANLELSLKAKSRKYIFDNYFYKKPILYNNAAYMELFSNFFSDFILTSKDIQPNDIFSNVNKKIKLNAILDSLGKDSILRNELLRETVLILNIRSWYSQKEFKSDSLLKLLDIYAANTKFDIQENIAKNLKFILTRNKNGNKMPEFSFKSIDNDVFNNDSLANKYTYFVFFHTWSKSSLSELLAMNKLHSAWKDSIQFIGVSMDYEPLKLFYFLQENKFDFPIYHFGGDWVMAENIGLLSFPHYMFIDKKGNYINYFAASPSRNVEAEFVRKIGKNIVKVQPEIGR